MKEITYSISGTVIYNEAENDEGVEEIEINETVEVEEMSAEKAKEKFFNENPQYTFMGSLKTCDQETGGKKGATFRDQNEDLVVDVELI